ncbi:Holliday junction branch migration DNA helicase RuvB [Candidatus Parcubacteria bacterium]|nr:Holliday junction branch migration DNA helicase RuvB [Candidatus Parcubacteria bacterium]
MIISKKNNCILKKDKSCKDDEILDNALRPKNWEEYIGQEKLKKNLRIIIQAAKQRKEAPDHLLFYGSPGLGKSTISHLIAKEMEADIKTTSGPAIEKAGDLASILTNLEDGDVLFIDEIHRLNKVCEEIFYPAMEDFKLNLILGKGPMARTMEMKLPSFTLIGATTRLALLSSPLRNRFGAIFQIDFYDSKDIEKIVEHSSKILNIAIEPKAVTIIAKCSRYTPRVANRLLKRIRDFAQVEGDGIIDEKITKSAMKFLEIDELGLEPGDRKIIQTIIKKFEGGPVGLKTLSAATSEEEDTILDIYEPYLMQLGFIERTPKGRMATLNAYKHLGIKYKREQNLL